MGIKDDIKNTFQTIFRNFRFITKVRLNCCGTKILRKHLLNIYNKLLAV